MRGAALDAEHVDVQVGSDLVAHTDTVSEKVEQGQDQGNPEDNILINKAVKILVKEQQCWTYECCVIQIHLTLGHVGNHQFICDLSRYKAKSQDVKAGVPLKELHSRFLVDHCSQGDH